MMPDLGTDVPAWGDSDFAEFFRLFGSKLLLCADIPKAVYLVATDLTGESGDSTALGDDIFNSDSFRDGFSNYDKGPLVWIFAESGYPASDYFDSVNVLDFGFEDLLVAWPPNAHDGRDEWEIMTVIRADDEAAKREIVLDFLSQGRTADSMSIEVPSVTREDIHRVFTTALDSGLAQSWAGLADSMNFGTDDDYPITTAAQRHACLAAYLDQALQP